MQDYDEQLRADGGGGTDKPVKPCGAALLGLGGKVQPPGVGKPGVQEIIPCGVQSDKTAGFKLTGDVLGQMLGRHGLDDATGRAVEQTTEIFFKAFHIFTSSCRDYSTARAGGQAKEEQAMTILDKLRPTPDRVEQMRELLDELSDRQREEIAAIMTGMLIQAELTERRAG